MTDFEILHDGYLAIWKVNEMMELSPADSARLLDFLLKQGVQPDDCVVMDKARYQHLHSTVTDLFNSLAE